MRTSERAKRLRRRLPTGAALAAALALCAWVAAGCGGGSAAPHVASLATAPAATQAATTSGAAKPGGGTQTFSACMRANGVPKFPDANGDGGIAIDASSGIDPDSAQFKAAEKACQKLAPKGGKEPSPAELAKSHDQELQFSACMRSHGLPKFPDPVFSDGGRRTQLHVDEKSGLDPSSPIFQTAQKTCQKLLPADLKRGSVHTGGPRPAGSSTQGTAGP